MQSIKTKEIYYRDTLKADVYLPIMKISNQKFPCIIFVSSFPGINFRHVEVYRDWAKLVAANGFVGVVYETNLPSIDFDELTKYIKTNATSLGVDQSRIGIWSCSANSLLAVSKLNMTNQFKCHSIYYGLTATLSSKYLKEVEDLSKQNGFAYEVKAEYNSRIPTLIVRAGKDHYKIILSAMDEFISTLLTKNIPFKLINYDQGRHGFDVLDNNDISKDIILTTIEFFKKELN